MRKYFCDVCKKQIEDSPIHITWRQFHQDFHYACFRKLVTLEAKAKYLPSVSEELDERQARNEYDGN